MSESTPSKVAFVFDDRLSHDRKTFFARTVSILKPKFNFDIISASVTEAGLIELIEKGNYSLILLPWYQYLAWKKVEAHLGNLRMQGTTTAGYFADAVLPFEFPKIPNYHRLIMLDFYRMDQYDIEGILSSLIDPAKRVGFGGIITPQQVIYKTEWHESDHLSLRCVDNVFQVPFLKSSKWHARNQSFRYFLVGLWTLCFQNKMSSQSSSKIGSLEIAETNHRIAIKLTFDSTDLTLKHLMEYFWPTQDQTKHQAIEEMIRHSDFLRCYQFPETHQIEITAYFTDQAPSIHHPSEVRGFWIEPLKAKTLKDYESKDPFKTTLIQRNSKKQIPEHLQEMIETLRAIEQQIGHTPKDYGLLVESQLTQIQFLVTEIEKKVAEKKKVA